MDKIDNVKIKNYIIKFVEKKLNRCEIFNKTFDKEFVKQRLEKNLDKVYTDIYSANFDGMYYPNSKCITIFSRKKHARKLTIEDIKNNKRLQQIIVHEIIHAIFCRTKEECENYQINSGVGIQERYANGIELGRGINEGLTEWLCEKVGYKLDNYYLTETNIVRLLELAIGEEKVIQLFNGGIIKNVTQVLQMGEEECKKFILNVDNISKYKEEIEQINAIIDVLSKRKNKILTPKMQEKIKIKLGEDYDKYAELIEELKGEEKEGINNNSINVQLDYFNNKLTTLENLLCGGVIETENIIFEKYFKNEIEEMMNSEKISRKTIKRFNKVYHCMERKEKNRDSIKNQYLSEQFKDHIYEELVGKCKTAFLEKIEINVQKIIKRKIQLTRPDIKFLQSGNRVEQFKKNIGDMTNYSKLPEDPKEQKCDEKQKEINEYEL